MEETAQLVPPRNPLGERRFPRPPTPPLSLFAPSGLCVTSCFLQDGFGY
ncbi:MAG: hypothetical protein HYW48_05480 [Deltaproteobacteria bacterium]|nr:hypothetical protein [Deltaproteobacteria bacterium]